jgi:hypothetical protein
MRSPTTVAELAREIRAHARVAELRRIAVAVWCRFEFARLNGMSRYEVAQRMEADLDAQRERGGNAS